MVLLFQRAGVGECMVLRGGSWAGGNPWTFRAGNGNRSAWNFIRETIGFRCAKDLKQGTKWEMPG